MANSQNSSLCSVQDLSMEKTQCTICLIIYLNTDKTEWCIPVGLKNACTEVCVCVWPMIKRALICTY